MAEYLCFVAGGFYRFLATSPKVTTRNVAELVKNKRRNPNKKAKKIKTKATSKANNKEQCKGCKD